jgi:transposase
VGVSSAVVSNIWKRFCQDGTISPKKNRGGNPSHLSQGDLQYDKFFKKQRPSISYNEIIEQLNEFGDLPYGTMSTTALSEAVRHRLPSGKEYSYKKLQPIAQERFTLQNIAYTQLFVNYLNSKDPYTLKFFDECGLKLPQHGTHSYGHAPDGEHAIEYQIHRIS